MFSPKVRSIAGASVLAFAALAACASQDEDAEDGADALSGACVATKEKFYAAGSKQSWENVKRACSADVQRHKESQAQNFAWFNDSPLGLAGPPLGVLLAIMEDDTKNWPDTLGLGQVFPTGEDKDHPRMGLPFGMVYQRNPETNLNHVFFSCGACHTGRVVGPDGQIKLITGAPNTEIDAQLFGWRLRTSILERYAKVETAVQNGKAVVVYDDEGFPKFTLTPEGKALENKAQAKVRSMPGIGINSAKEWVTLGLAWNTVMKKLVAGAVKTDMLYGKLQNEAGAYKAGDPKSPLNAGPRPGRMDAYGFASGLVYTHAMRDDYFAKIKARYGADYKNHPFFKGIQANGDTDLFLKARDRIRSNPKEWLSPEPAPIDVKSLFFLDDRPNVGWDANQATSARVIASGTSAVGDPWNVNLPIHEGMNDFVKMLPPDPYPFEVDAAKARAGAKLYEAKCATCHKPGNAMVYRLEALKTDPNRAKVVGNFARVGLIELMHQACDGTGNGTDLKQNVSLEGYGKSYDKSWCVPKGSLAEQDNALFRAAATRENPNVGYKADDLRGVWVQAPYLHNGSVPTLWHLLNPNERPKTFVRGNINFDRKNVGFDWQEQSPRNYEGARTVVFDTTLRGQSNGGHTFGSELSADEKWQLIEYMKTL